LSRPHLLRLRAERKAGQLLAQMEKAKGAREPGTNRGSTPSGDTRASTLSDLGISYDQSSQWQKLGAVPDDEFDRAMEEAERPTTKLPRQATAPASAREGADASKCRHVEVSGRRRWRRSEEVPVAPFQPPRPADGGRADPPAPASPREGWSDASRCRHVGRRPGKCLRRSGCLRLRGGLAAGARGMNAVIALMQRDPGLPGDFAGLRQMWRHVQDSPAYTGVARCDVVAVWQRYDGWLRHQRPRPA